MARELKTSEELRQIVQDGIDKIHEVQEDGEDVVAGGILGNEPDDTGCNWHMPFARNAGPYKAAVQAVIVQAQSRYNMK